MNLTDDDLDRRISYYFGNQKHEAAAAVRELRELSWSREGKPEDKARAFLLELHDNKNPKDMEETERDNFYRDFGLLIHFLKWRNEKLPEKHPLMHCQTCGELIGMDHKCKELNPCDWKQDEDGCWESDCKQRFIFNEWQSPRLHGFKFCPYCGKPITETPYKEEE